MSEDIGPNDSIIAGDDLGDFLTPSSLVVGAGNAFAHVPTELVAKRKNAEEKSIEKQSTKAEETKTSQILLIVDASVIDPNTRAARPQGKVGLTSNRDEDLVLYV